MEDWYSLADRTVTNNNTLDSLHLICCSLALPFPLYPSMSSMIHLYISSLRLHRGKRDDVMYRGPKGARCR